MIFASRIMARNLGSDASVQAGAVNSEHLSEGEKKSVSLYYIVFIYRRHWTDDV